MKTGNPRPKIRKATPQDTPEIHSLVCQLAEYEKLGHTVTSTPADLNEAFFGSSPRAEALVAESPDLPKGNSSPSLVGTAIFFSTFSTFTGKPSLWLEDVFIRPEYRGNGIGTRFLELFLSLARERGCARAEWAVLDWNEPAIRFYEQLGASVMPDLRIVRFKL